MIVFHLDFGSKGEEFDGVAYEVVVSLPELNDLCYFEVFISLTLDIVGINFVLKAHNFNDFF